MLKILASIMIPLMILFVGLSVQYVWAVPLAFACVVLAIVFMQQDQWENDRGL